MTRESLRSALDLSHRAGTLRVRNILNPLLWLVAVSTPACFVAGGSIGFETTLGAVVTLVGLAPIALALIVYVVFAARDPDRLQSEEFVIRTMELKLLETRAGPIGPIETIETAADPGPPLVDGDRRDG